MIRPGDLAKSGPEGCYIWSCSLGGDGRRLEKFDVVIVIAIINNDNERNCYVVGANVIGWTWSDWLTKL